MQVTIFRLDKSAISRGEIPFFASSNIHRGLMPNLVTFCSSTTRTSVLASGWNGEPSYMTDRAPTSSAPTLARYIIQPTVVYCSVTLSRPMPSCSLPSLK